MEFSRLTKREVVIYQIGLQELGLYLGEIDGDPGPLTRAADADHAVQWSQDEKESVGAQWWSGPSEYATRTGVRLMNPLNVKGLTSSYWREQVGRDARGHAKFRDPVWGTRAAIKNLSTYWRRGRRTVLEIIHTWAPPSDTQGSLPNRAANDPSAYASAVAAKLFVGVRTRLDLFDAEGRVVRDREQMRKLIAAMAEYEIGAGFRLAPEVIEGAMDRL